jgi:hypothetical protein
VFAVGQSKDICLFPSPANMSFDDSLLVDLPENYCAVCGASNAHAS